MLRWKTSPFPYDKSVKAHSTKILFSSALIARLLARRRRQVVRAT